MAAYTISLADVIETLKIPRNAWTLTVIAKQEGIRLHKKSGTWYTTAAGAKRLRAIADQRKAKGYTNGQRNGKVRGQAAGVLPPELPLDQPAPEPAPEFPQGFPRVVRNPGVDWSVADLVCTLRGETRAALMNRLLAAELATIKAALQA